MLGRILILMGSSGTLPIEPNATPRHAYTFHQNRGPNKLRLESMMLESTEEVKVWDSATASYTSLELKRDMLLCDRHGALPQSTVKGLVGVKLVHCSGAPSVLEVAHTIRCP